MIGLKRMVLVAAVVGATSGLSVSLSVGAWAQDNPACAKFDDPLAYNACLAKLGPAAREVRADESEGAVRAPAPTSRIGPRVAWPAKRGWTHGRAHAEFVVKPR
jgi:hypothetical protein